MLEGGEGVEFEHRKIKIVAGSSRYILVRYMVNIQTNKIKPYINNICTNPTPAIMLVENKLYTPKAKIKKYVTVYNGLHISAPTCIHQN